MKKVVVVLPTYNEKDNIARVIESIFAQTYQPHYEINILVVDDSSPDGTGQIVTILQSKFPKLFLLKGQKQGLGVAYIRGFEYAIKSLAADILFEMDADLSHDSSAIPLFLNEIEQGADFIIGSRYITDGSIPANWPALRKANSRWGNIFARYVSGLKKVQDCTSGFRAIKVESLQKINLNQLQAKGYSFQLNLLYQAVKSGATVKEIPITFIDRVEGKSKLSSRDIIEFIFNSFLIRFSILRFLPHLLIATFVFCLLVLLPLNLISAHILSPKTLFYSIVIFISTLVSLQGLLSLYWMLYAWNNVEEATRSKSPTQYSKPNLSFTALLPARHESEVIGDTIQAISDLDYPENLKEILIICRTDDKATISKVWQTIAQLHKPNIRLVTFDDEPINKPHSLNIGLTQASKDVIVIFDAEDHPHQDIYQIVNTVMTSEQIDVVQSGVQLMNFRSTWFSTLNVLEYFFWFKSTMHYFAKKGIIPLGGNTVFFKKEWLAKVGGWDETCLTEDADIGIRLSIAGAKIKVIYDEKHVTREETPHNLTSFIKQRTRWNQGFIQIFLKKDWQKLPNLPTFFPRLLALYILILPQIQMLFFLMIPISILMSFELNLPIWITLAVIAPFYILLLQLITYNIGLFLFTKDYKLQYKFWYPLIVILTFYPFQVILGFSAFRAVGRVLLGKKNWEKTVHINAHRDFLKSSYLETVEPESVFTTP